jgi:hypothetical protein
MLLHLVFRLAASSNILYYGTEEVHQYFPSTLLLKVYTILDLHNFVLSVRCWLVFATSTTDVKQVIPSLVVALVVDLVEEEKR